ncbi:MAG: hypothetical protein H7839_14380 [Magnetococcus sp. YQC-5]
MAEETITKTGDWLYEPGEWGHKHKWSHDYPDFILVGNDPIGKCPTSITRNPELAKELLDTGVYYPTGTQPPDKIYNVHQGVIYRAIETRHGVSFHGFPEKEHKIRRVPPSVLRQLARIAKEKNTLEEFKQWMCKHLPEGYKQLQIYLRSL